ncbi:cytochrome P450 [Lactifluus volemus]|nr:cytochrome P450 [Lactifluus volemus]
MIPRIPVGCLLFSAVAFALFALVARIYVSSRARRRGGGLRYPPGPRGLPLFGNIFDIPQYSPWETYTRWGKRYGDVTSVSVFGRLIVFVNSARAAKDLFERTGMRYMDRPVIPIIDMMGAHFNLAITRYSPKWRVERRIVDQCLRPAVTATYHDMQTRKAHAFLGKVLRRPDKTMEHLRLFIAAVVMSLTYGYDVRESSDHFVVVAEELLTLARKSMSPGALLVNDLPALKYLPDWFPGTEFKRRAKYGMKLCHEMVNAPFDMLKGTSKHSLVHDNLGECKDEEDEKALKNVAASVYAAGAETTISTLSSFFLVLLLYPDVQKRAQAEIDEVIGRGRLPGLDDRPSLPYVDGLCKELLRWRLVLPLGVAHATTEDDVYSGYFIPKGTMVLPNTWAILHDPEVYADPETFKPERFLTDDGKKVIEDPLLMYAFGYGRRICPGRDLVDSTIWILIASVLAAFDVHKKIDGHGKEIPVEGVYNHGLISQPAPFEYDISPRHEEVMRLVPEAVRE